MTWAYSISLRPDGKYRLRTHIADHGDYLTMAEALAAMTRLINPSVMYYDGNGMPLHEK